MMASIGAAVGFAGCAMSDGDAFEGESPLTTESSVTPTPTPTTRYKPGSAKGPAENVPLPVVPVEAKTASKVGLEAFAEYWYETANYGYETGDTSLTQAVSGPECETCANYFEVVEGGYIGDDWMANSAIEVLQVHSDYVLTPDGRYQAVVYFRQEAMEYYGPEGLQLEGEADLGVVQLFEAVWEGDHWVAANIATMNVLDKCQFHPENPDC